MTNYEMLKQQNIHVIALVLRCPVEAGFIDDYRCTQKGKACAKCTLEWLQEKAEFSYLLRRDKP